MQPLHRGLQQHGIHGQLQVVVRRLLYAALRVHSTASTTAQPTAQLRWSKEWPTAYCWEHAVLCCRQAGEWVRWLALPQWPRHAICVHPPRPNPTQSIRQQPHLALHQPQHGHEVAWVAAALLAGPRPPHKQQVVHLTHRTGRAVSFGTAHRLLRWPAHVYRNWRPQGAWHGVLQHHAPHGHVEAQAGHGQGAWHGMLQHPRREPQRVHHTLRHGHVVMASAHHPGTSACCPPTLPPPPACP